MNITQLNCTAKQTFTMMRETQGDLFSKLI